MTKNISPFLPVLPITKGYLPAQNQNTICKIVKLAGFLLALPFLLIADLLYSAFYCGARLPKPIVPEPPKLLPEPPAPEPVKKLPLTPTPLPTTTPEPTPIPTPPAPEPTPIPTPPTPVPTPPAPEPTPSPEPAPEPTPPKVVEPIVPPPQELSLFTKVGLAAFAVLGVGTLAYLIRSYTLPGEPRLIVTDCDESEDLPLLEPTVKADKPLLLLTAEPEMQDIGPQSPFNLAQWLNDRQTNTTETLPPPPRLQAPLCPLIPPSLHLSGDHCFFETEPVLLPSSYPRFFDKTPSGEPRLVVTDCDESEDLPVPEPKAEADKPLLLLTAEPEMQDVGPQLPFNLAQWLENRQTKTTETLPPPHRLQAPVCPVIPHLLQLSENQCFAQTGWQPIVELEDDSVQISQNNTQNSTTPNISIEHKEPESKEISSPLTPPPPTPAPPPPSPGKSSSSFPWLEFGAASGAVATVGGALYGLYKWAAGEDGVAPAAPQVRQPPNPHSSAQRTTHIPRSLSAAPQAIEPDLSPPPPPPQALRRIDTTLGGLISTARADGCVPVHLPQGVLLPHQDDLRQMRNMLRRGDLSFLDNWYRCPILQPSATRPIDIEVQPRTLLQGLVRSKRTISAPENEALPSKTIPIKSAPQHFRDRHALFLDRPIEILFMDTREIPADWLDQQIETLRAASPDEKTYIPLPCSQHSQGLKVDGMWIESAALLDSLLKARQGDFDSINRKTLPCEYHDTESGQRILDSDGLTPVEAIHAWYKQTDILALAHEHIQLVATKAHTVDRRHLDALWQDLKKMPQIIIPANNSSPERLIDTAPLCEVLEKLHKTRGQNLADWGAYLPSTQGYLLAVDLIRELTDAPSSLHFHLHDRVRTPEETADWLLSPIQPLDSWSGLVGENPDAAIKNWEVLHLIELLKRANAYLITIPDPRKNVSFTFLRTEFLTLLRAYWLYRKGVQIDQPTIRCEVHFTDPHLPRENGTFSLKRMQNPASSVSLELSDLDAVEEIIQQHWPKQEDEGEPVLIDLSKHLRTLTPPPEPQIPIQVQPTQQDRYLMTAKGWLQWFQGRIRNALYEFDLEQVRPEHLKLLYVDAQHFYDRLNTYAKDPDDQIQVECKIVPKDGSAESVKAFPLSHFLEDFQTPGSFVREYFSEQENPHAQKIDLWLQHLSKCAPNQYCRFKLDNEDYSQIVMRVSLLSSALGRHKTDPEQKVECAWYPIHSADPQISYEKIAALLDAFHSVPEIIPEQIEDDPAREAARRWDQFLTSDSDSAPTSPVFNLDPNDTQAHFEAMSCTTEHLKQALQLFLTRSSDNPTFPCAFHKQGSDPVLGTASLKRFLERYPDPLSNLEQKQSEQQAIPLIATSDLDTMIKEIELHRTNWKKYLILNETRYLNVKELVEALNSYKANRSANGSIKYYLPSNAADTKSISLFEILPELIQQDQIKKDRAWELHHQQISTSDICKELGISKATLDLWIKRHSGSSEHAPNQASSDSVGSKEEASLSEFDQLFLNFPTPSNRAHLSKQPVPVKRRLYELTQKGNIRLPSAVRTQLINGASDPRNKVFIRSGGFRITNKLDSEAVDPKSLPWNFKKIFDGLNDNLDVISFEGRFFDSVDDLLNQFGTSTQELLLPENQGKFDSLISTLCCLTPAVAKTCETYFLEECKKIGLTIAPKEFNYLKHPLKPRIHLLYNRQHKTTSIEISHDFLIGKPLPKSAPNQASLPQQPKPVPVQAVLTFAGEHLNSLQILPSDPATVRSIEASFIANTPAKFEWIVPPESEQKNEDKPLVLPPLDALPEAPSLWNWGWSFIPSIDRLSQYATYLSHVLFHQPHLAHNHKYRIALNTEIEFLKNWLAKDSLSADEYLKILQNENQKNPSPFLGHVIEAIHALLTPSDSIRTQNSTYLYALRNALQSDEYRQNQQEFQGVNKLLRGLAWARFANNWMQKYEESLIELATNRRYTELRRSNIADAIEETNTALYECPLDLKKAPQDGAWQKFSNSFGVYSDPIGKSNVPEVRSVHMAKRDGDKESYPVLHLRHGTPTWQRKILERETIVPEYHAFLDAAEERKLNVLYVNHQKMWKSSNPETSAECHRANSIQALENEHKNFYFLSLPYDGRIWSADTLEIRDSFEWKQTVINALVDGTDGFRLPKGYDTSTDEERSALKNYFLEIAERVEEFYFPSHYLDSPEIRKIFLAIFFAYVKDVVKAKYKIQVMASPCKDDKDRGNASKGIDDAIFNLRTGLDDDPAALHRLYVRSLAPFTIKYEGIIKERLNLLLGVLKHIGNLTDEARKKIPKYTPGCAVEPLPHEEDELFSTPTQIGSKLFLHHVNTDTASATPLHQIQFKSFDAFVKEACLKAGTVYLPLAQSKLLASIPTPETEDEHRLACLTDGAWKLCDAGLDKFLKNTSPYPPNEIVRERINPPSHSSRWIGDRNWENILEQQYLLQFGKEQIRVCVRAVTDSFKRTQVTIFPIRE